MNRDKVIEQRVSDAIAERPEHFTIKYKEIQEVDIEVSERRYLKHIPFLYRTEVVTKQESKSVDLERVFTIHRPTLGQLQLMSKPYLLMDIDEAQFESNPMQEVMRICETKSDHVTEYIAYSVIGDKDDLLNPKIVGEVADFIKWHCTPNDLALCLLVIHSQIECENFLISIRCMKIARQNKPMQKRANRVE